MAYPSSGTAPPTPHEITLIKEYFRTNAGHDQKINESELNKALPDWTARDRRELFASFDKHSDGCVNYVAFVDWVMDSTTAGRAPKQDATSGRKRGRSSAETLSIPSQAEAASSIGNAVPLYEFVPANSVISTTRQVGEVKNGDTCIILKEDGRGNFNVRHGDVEGWAAAEHFHNRKYRLLLNLKLCQEFEDVYKKTLEAISKFGCCTVLRAFQEGRTYAHLTLNYDFEVDGEQLQELIAVLETFAATNVRVPLRMNGADAFGASVIFLDVDRQHEDYNRAMKLHLDLVESLRSLRFTKSKKDEKDIHWHATVAYKDIPADQKDEVLKCIRDTATPVECYFDNVTIMAKVGPSQPYAGTAIAAMSFPLKNERGQYDKFDDKERQRDPLRLLGARATYAHAFDKSSLSKIADHQFSISPKDIDGAKLSTDEQELVQGTSFSWFKPLGDLKHVVVMLHGWALVMNPHTLGEISTASGQDGLASLISAGYDVLIPEFPANPKALGSSKDVQWAQGVCGPTDVGTFRNPANHPKMAAYLDALLKFFGLVDGTHKPVIIASSYSGYFVSSWLMGLDKEDAKPRDNHVAALVLLAGATTAEGNFLTNYDKKPAEQSQDVLSAVDEKNWKELTDHRSVLTGPLQQSLAQTPVMYMRGSNDQLFPASAAAYLGLDRQELQMIRRSSDQDSFGEVDYAEKPVYRWVVNCKSGHAPKVMAVLKDAPHALYFLEKAGTLQPLRYEINHFLQESLDAPVKLAKINGLRDATRAGAGIYWDFASSKAKLGRTWHEHAPDHVREQLSRDCTEEELKECRAMTKIDQIPPAPEDTRPEVLIIIGPSGAGKTAALPRAAKMFGLDLSKFANVDGDDMRSCHTAWRTLVVEDHVNGYLDAYDIYTANKKNKDLKKFYSKECLKSRRNVIFPWTNIEQAALDLIKQMGYVVNILGLLISCAESDCRQKNRAETTGRWADTPAKKWQVTVDHLTTLCQPTESNRVLILESTDLLNMRVVHARGVPDIEDPGDLENTIKKLQLDMQLE